MSIHTSFFGLGNTYNPAYRIDRWFNPFSIEKTITKDGKPCRVRLTKRAQQVLQLRDMPLLVEMQLYYSCVIKKRVLFHTRELSGCVIVNELLGMTFHAVQSTSCDPVEFAQNHPVKRELEPVTARGMFPSLLELDYKNSTWQGEFFI